ncbi:MAG TPA: cell division protein FtsK [Lachnospiraceae bacterium]|nr:cell division protein FtsK [Lachnospiraceae bacterium]
MQRKGTTSSRRRGPSRKKKQDLFVRECILWFALAVCLILFLSTFGICGVVGNLCASFFFGLFGLMGYVFPILFFVLIRLGLGNKPLGDKFRLNGSLLVLFLCICGMSQLLFAGNTADSALELYKAAVNEHLCGGMAGGLLAKGLSYIVGESGAYILMTAGMIISLVLLTRRSFLEPIKNGSEKAVRTVQKRQKEMAQGRRDHSNARKNLRQEERAHRKEQSQSGVNFELTDLKHSGEKPSAPQRETEESPKKAKIASMDDFRVESEKRVSSEIIQEPEPVPEKKPEFHIERPLSPVDPAPVIECPPVETEQEPETVPGEIKKPKKMTEKEKHQQSQEILSEIADQEPVQEEYKFPPMTLLQKSRKGKGGDSDQKLYETAQKLESTLKSFGVKVTVTNASCGPTVTRYELQPEQGVKVSRIVNLADDIKLNLAVADIRIEAPIPGKAAVGIEVPNETNSAVYLRDLLDTPQFKQFDSRLAFAVGKDIAGQPVITDIGKMPHLLIAGATGSGKSVCINTLIMSILFKARPDEVKLIMIDPKVVELSVYNGIPHLLIPVVTDPKKAAGALNWAVAEMEDRYNKFAKYNVRDMKGYNKKVEAIENVEDEDKPVKMPQIVVIVDELADLMMVASKEVEDAICRLAQLARAAGIHLIIATQRPSVNVITGLIKANMPSRVAFAVSSGVDSRTILDMVGAEKLLGKGDMLFYPQGYPKPARLQGSFVSDKEVGAVVDFLTADREPVSYDESISEKITNTTVGGTTSAESDRDSLFGEAGRFIIEKDKASIGMLQRMFKIGFNRAARIMDQLCEAGVVTGEEGTKPRKVLMTMEEFENL